MEKIWFFTLKKWFLPTLIGMLFKYSNSCVAKHSNPIFPTNPSPNVNANCLANRPVAAVQSKLYDEHRFVVATAGAESMLGKWWATFTYHYAGNSISPQRWSINDENIVLLRPYAFSRVHSADRRRRDSAVKYIRGAFTKFCNSTIKKNRNVTNYTLLLNIISTEFNAFATFFLQTVNSTEIEIFCLSRRPLLDSFIERLIVRIADRRSESFCNLAW